MHVMRCLQFQQQNLRASEADGVFFTYEEMCADPLAVGKSIVELVPLLYDLRLDQTVAVKGTYHERLRDMNGQQISRLNSADLGCVNTVLDTRAARRVMDFFCYDLMRA
jgi:hypothetical protein